MALGGSCRRILGVRRSYPGDFLTLRFCRRCLTSEGLTALGGRESGIGEVRNSSTSEVWLGCVSGWGVKVLERCLANSSDFSSSEAAQEPSSCRRGWEIWWDFRNFLVTLQRDLSLVEREDRKVLKVWER